MASTVRRADDDGSRRIALSLVGIIGVINQAYLKNAIWKK